LLAYAQANGSSYVQISPHSARHDIDLTARDGFRINARAPNALALSELGAPPEAIDRVLAYFLDRAAKGKSIASVATICQREAVWAGHPVRWWHLAIDRVAGAIGNWLIS
jgi:hypothetical protein